MVRSLGALGGIMGFSFLAAASSSWAQAPAQPPAAPASTTPANDTAVSTGPLKLNEAMAAAYETNPQLAEARAALAALDQNVAQANAGWRPSVNATVQQGYDHGILSPLLTPGGHIVYGAALFSLAGHQIRDDIARLKRKGPDSVQPSSPVMVSQASEV